MITLRTAKQSDFDIYKPLFIADYSEDLIENHDLSSVQALNQATTELVESFPAGSFSDHNHLLCIDLNQESEVHVVGYLWYSVDSKFKQAFICDFYVLENFRSYGYGRSALKALEDRLLPQSIDQIKLRVAYTNHRAFRLYEELGFKPTGINMVKWLGRS